MAKVTSKLQVTIPKALARRCGIRPGDDVDWSATSEGLHITQAPTAGPLPVEVRLELFDRASERQKRRQRSRKGHRGGPKGRGWAREDLYDRGRSR